MSVAFDQINCVLTLLTFSLNDNSIYFDQASVKSRSVYFVLKIEKNQEVTGLKFRKRGYL